MPATFPSHAAAVLPLKLWRPRRFDGVALVPLAVLRRDLAGVPAYRWLPVQARAADRRTRS